MICRLFAWLFGRPDYRGPWTTGPRGGGPLLDDFLARERADAIRWHIRQEDTAAGARPIRIGMYLELHRKGGHRPLPTATESPARRDSRT